MMERKRKVNLKQKALGVDKRIKLDGSEEQVNLLDLPVGPLHMIISKVHPEKQMILRNASSKLRVEHSDCMLHSYKSFTNLHLRQQHLCAEQQRIHNVMQVVAHSTDFFISSGYNGVLAGNLIFFYKHLTTGVQSIDAAHMHKFLHEFYSNLEGTVPQWPNEAAARIAFNQRRLIYTMTLLNLLRQFRNFRIVSSGMNLMHWQLQLEVLGLHFGVREMDGQTPEQDKLVDFLTIIAEMLVFDKSRTYESRYTAIGNSFYIYGIKQHTRLSRQSQKLTLNLSILAPLVVRVLLENVLNGQVDIARPIHCPVVDTFSIQLDVKGRKIPMWDGSNHMEICIVPLH
ncbi:uncharacterized protein LOC6581635 [Drosophila mojavensis]|uniref:Uncharacterized protein n=1 Tax=Drosophila mojavensis TaxID=7230 RepID=B4KZ38_DROMO|nr:uncharacterized protein LOC6581635 [Drosophila mojavensis]XP_043865678.1 uncharacterized protein LOC6581635 [Drosophila mojavensis]EDW17835.2 uncharacterized protein Dmoj_GI12428 [Drosophila mojavensis]